MKREERKSHIWKIYTMAIQFISPRQELQVTGVSSHRRHHQVVSQEEKWPLSPCLWLAHASPMNFASSLLHWHIPQHSFSVSLTSSSWRSDHSDHKAWDVEGKRKRNTNSSTSHPSTEYLTKKELPQISALSVGTAECEGAAAGTGNWTVMLLSYPGLSCSDPVMNCGRRSDLRQTRAPTHGSTIIEFYTESGLRTYVCLFVISSYCKAPFP